MRLPEFGRRPLLAALAAWRRVCLSRRLAADLAAVASRAAFVYADNPSPEAWLAARAAEEAAVPLIYEMRGEPLPLSYLGPRFGLAGLAYALAGRLMDDRVRRKAAAGLYVSDFLMHQYPVGGADSAAIPDLRLGEIPDALPKMYSSPARRFLYVGSVDRIKRIELLLGGLTEARGHLGEDWRLNVVGDGPDLQRLMSMSKTLGLERNVVFRGRVKWGPELFRYYRESDLFLLTSLTEGGAPPRAAAEAMSFGLPVLSTPLGGIAAWLPAEAVFDSTRPEAVGRKIASASRDCECLTRWSKFSVEWARTMKRRSLHREREEFFARQLNHASWGPALASPDAVCP
jgi:glycosyltransferase involved in cell wall biosynthesis